MKLHSLMMVFVLLGCGIMDIDGRQGEGPDESLEILAGSEAKFLGNISQGENPPGNYKDWWHQMTLENSGKWSAAEPQRDQMNWQQIDGAYAYCLENNIIFKWHTPFWDPTEPDWLKGLSQNEIRDEIIEWVSQFMNRYPKTAIIDGINEALHKKTGAVKKPLEAMAAPGDPEPRWVFGAYRLLRKYAPTAKLLYNDFWVLSGAALKSYVDLTSKLKAANLIDGLGVQGHFLETASAERVQLSLDTLAKIGLPVYITELDLTSTDDASQLQLYKSIFSTIWDHPAVKGVTLWGYRKNAMWRRHGWLYDPKTGYHRPALDWLLDYVSSKGKTIISIYAAGRTHTENMDLYINGQKVKGWMGIGGDAQNKKFNVFSYIAKRAVKASEVRVVFPNDNGRDRDLRVDKVKIGASVYESESSKTYSVGSWNASTRCAGGYKRSEWLHCNGYFQY